MNKFKPVILMSLLFLSSQFGVAQGDVSHWQVLQQPAKSVAANIATVTAIGFIDSTDLANYDVPWWLPTIISTQHMPMYKLNPKIGLRYSILEAGFLGAHYATKKNPSVTQAAINLYTKTAWYCSYEMYAYGRENALKGIYPDDWRRYSVKDLTIANFQWKNLSHPIVAVPVGLSLWAAINRVRKSDTSIFRTNTAFVDGEELPVGVALPSMIGLNLLTYITTGIGEEALYRGVIYEELKVNYGPKKAKLYDFFLFPAIHVPMDIARGKGGFDIGKQFVIRGFSTLLFDYAYDKGGLPMSVAMHTWFNFLSFTSTWMAEGGVPEKPGDELDQNGSPPMSISFSIKF